jgi:hypothetical protein
VVQWRAATILESLNECRLPSLSLGGQKSTVLCGTIPRFQLAVGKDGRYGPEILNLPMFQLVVKISTVYF